MPRTSCQITILCFGSHLDEICLAAKNVIAGIQAFCVISFSTLKGPEKNLGRSMFLRTVG